MFIFLLLETLFMAIVYKDFLAAFIVLIISFVASPFFNIVLDRKIGIRIPFILRVIIVLIGFCIAVGVLAIDQENKNHGKNSTSIIQTINSYYHWGY